MKKNAIWWKLSGDKRIIREKHAKKDGNLVITKE